MTISIQPKIGIQILTSTASSNSGTTNIVPPPPGQFPLNVTSDDYWENWVLGGKVYGWNGTHWSTPSSGVTLYGLQARTDGPQGNWPEGVRASSLTLETNAASDDGFGSLTANSFALRDTGGNTVASNTSIDYSDWDTDQQVIIMPIDNSADLDYDVIQIITFLYNTGPLISSIIFNE